MPLLHSKMSDVRSLSDGGTLRFNLAPASTGPKAEVSLTHVDPGPARAGVALFSGDDSGWSPKAYEDAWRGHVHSNERGIREAGPPSAPSRAAGRRAGDIRGRNPPVPRRRGLDD